MKRTFIDEALIEPFEIGDRVILQSHPNDGDVVRRGEVVCMYLEATEFAGVTWPPCTPGKWTVLVHLDDGQVFAWLPSCMTLER